MTPLELSANPGPATRLRWLISDSLLISKRNLSHVRQIPEKLIDVTLQPLVFVLLFALVFGGVVAVGGGDYREYLVGGIFVQTLAFGMVGPATAMATDLTDGIVDRFRTLPISRSSFLLGHLIAALAAAALSVAMLSVSGLIVGWEIHADLLHAVAGYALLFGFAFAMLWVGLLIGVSVRSPDAVAGIGFLIVLPMTFLASTFVPIESLSDGVRQIAEYNPVSSLAAATRTLFGNPTGLPADAPWTLAHPVASSLAWCGALLGIAVPLTVRRFRAKATG